MMKNIYSIAFALLVALSVMSCSKDSGKSGKLARPISNQELQKQLITLSDTLSSKWQVMVASDSMKTQQMEELLGSIPPNSISAQERANLQKAIRRLPTLRYDRRTMRDSDMIDYYDHAHDSVWNALQAYLPPAEVETGNALIDSLRNQIKEHHNEVVFYRARYDMKAKEMNTLLRRYRKRLPKLGKPYDTLQPAPLFQWVEKNEVEPVEEE
ncbi:hypothetical protein [Rufibacter roseus]|uniref:Lipoprotein n=1 Tax=Rufibacter roseus TaxID=1567108 RepID=A0ABW2DLT0_9BACT|nr:hypothetical protein [Rufibacter roseus]